MISFYDSHLQKLHFGAQNMPAVEADDKDGLQDNEINPEEKKRKIRPKFDENSLVRPNGITALKDRLSSQVKFSGHGNEAMYVQQLIRQYQAWSHNLAPWLAFEDTINRCQKLRGKKAVQELLQSMRDDEAEAFIERKFGLAPIKRQRAQAQTIDGEEKLISESESENDITNSDGKEENEQKRAEELKKKRARDAARRAILDDDEEEDDNHDFPSESPKNDSGGNESSGNYRYVPNENSADFYEDEAMFFEEEVLGAGPTEAELEAMMEMEDEFIQSTKVVEADANKVTKKSIEMQENVIASAAESLENKASPEIKSGIKAEEIHANVIPTGSDVHLQESDIVEDLISQDA